MTHFLACLFYMTCRLDDEGRRRRSRRRRRRRRKKSLDVCVFVSTHLRCRCRFNSSSFSCNVMRKRVMCRWPGNEELPCFDCYWTDLAPVAATRVSRGGGGGGRERNARELGMPVHIETASFDTPYYGSQTKMDFSTVCVQSEVPKSRADLHKRGRSIGNRDLLDD